MKDISVLKDMLRIEKNMNVKKEHTIKARDAELKEARDKTLETSKELNYSINELTIK